MPAPAQHPGSLRAASFVRVRLAKYLAHCGVASRRRAEALIAVRSRDRGGAGRRPIPRATSTSAAASRSTANRSVRSRARSGSLNKPLDVVSTAREPGARQAVTELVPSRRRLYPVGRLDADSTGLILLTNDGELANRLTHPRYGVERTYRATLRRAPSERDLARLRRGVRARGRADPARRRCGAPGKRGIEITIREGRNRQVRRMAEAIGNEVVSLRRVGFGPLRARRGSPKATRAGSARPRSKRLWKDARPMTERLWGMRGAAQAARNDAESILGATRELMSEVMERNGLEPASFVSVIFTCTDDLDARVPRGRRARARARPGPAALQPRDRRARGDAARDPAPRPLLRRRRPRARARLPGRDEAAPGRPTLGAVDADLASSAAGCDADPRLQGRACPRARRRRRSRPRTSPSSPRTSRPWGPHPEVLAAIERAAGAMNRYPDPGATLLRAADRDAARRRPGAIAVANGSCEFLLAAAAALCEHGRRDRLRVALVLDLPVRRAALGRARDPRAAHRRRRARPRRDAGRDHRRDPDRDRLQPEQPDLDPHPDRSDRRVRRGSPGPRGGDPRRGLRRVPAPRRPGGERRPLARAARTSSSCAPSPSATAWPGCGSATRSRRPRSGRRSTRCASRSRSTRSRRRRAPRRSATRTTSRSGSSGRSSSASSSRRASASSGSERRTHTPTSRGSTSARPTRARWSRRSATRAWSSVPAPRSAARGTSASATGRASRTSASWTRLAAAL